MKPTYLLLFFLIAICGCKKDVNSSHSSFNNVFFTSFSFHSSNNSKFITDILAEVDDSTITCSLPIGISADSLIATFTTNEVVNSVTVNGVRQVSGSTMHNFTQTIIYTLSGRDKSVRNYSVRIRPFTGLPVMYITTSDGAPITSKTDYVSGTVAINSNSSGFNAFQGAMQIRLRGNYTSTLPKKPYKLKLASKASILGMPEDKEWALLANYDDKSLIRNYVAFKLSGIFGLPYTPRSTFADVFINGVYQGNYQVCESVKISSSRVNIKSMDETDTSGSKLTGGYLFEVDNRLDGSDIFITNKNIDFVIHDPEYGNAAQINYLKNNVQQLEDAIYSADFADASKGYAKYLNDSSAINWFWVNEISSNRDALMYSSVWMYKDRANTIHVGPAWDFDLGFGNSREQEVSKPQGWYIRNAPWFSRLFHDPAFARKAQNKWQSVRTRLDSLNSFIDATAFYLKYSQANDAETWKTMNLYVFPNNEMAGSYQGEIAYLKNWLSARIKWIDANLQTLQN